MNGFGGAGAFSDGKYNITNEFGGWMGEYLPEEEVLDLILQAITKSGYKPGKDFMIALDAASSEWKTNHNGKYKMPKSGREFSTEELIYFWKNRYECFGKSKILLEESIEKGRCPKN